MPLAPPWSTVLALAGHLGDLHGVERVLVLLIALGPFAVLGAVVLVVRRRDVAEEEADRDELSASEEAERGDA